MDHELIWTPGISLEAMEKMIIKRAFAHYRKDKEQTCKSLGIAIRTLEYKLKKYEEEDEEIKFLQEKRLKEIKAQELRARFGDRVPIPEGLDAKPEVWSRPITNTSIQTPTSPAQVTTFRRKIK